MPSAFASAMTTSHLAYDICELPRGIADKICRRLAQQVNAKVIGDGNCEVVHLMNERVDELGSTGSRSDKHDGSSAMGIRVGEPAVPVAGKHQVFRLLHDALRSIGVIKTSQHSIDVVFLIREQEVDDPSSDCQSPLHHGYIMSSHGISIPLATQLI